MTEAASDRSGALAQAHKQHAEVKISKVEKKARKMQLLTKKRAIFMHG